MKYYLPSDAFLNSLLKILLDLYAFCVVGIDPNVFEEQGLAFMSPVLTEVG